MSGSGGGGGGFGGIRPGPSDVDNCDIVETTTLSSPKPEVIATLAVGDLLDVSLSDRVLLAVTSAGEVAGSLTPPALADLLRCIGTGHSYVAEVTTLSGGRCEVRIRPE